MFPVVQHQIEIERDTESIEIVVREKIEEEGGGLRPETMEHSRGRLESMPIDTLQDIEAMSTKSHLQALYSATYLNLKGNPIHQNLSTVARKYRYPVDCDDSNEGTE